MQKVEYVVSKSQEGRDDAVLCGVFSFDLRFFVGNNWDCPYRYGQRDRDRRASSRFSLIFRIVFFNNNSAV